MPGPGAWHFRYDGVDQLVHASGSMDLAPGKTDAFTEDYHYSTIHNLLDKQREHTVDHTRPPQTNFDYAYKYAKAHPHRAIQVGDLVQAFDPSGNVIERRKAGTGSTEQLTWDDDLVAWRPVRGARGVETRPRCSRSSWRPVRGARGVETRPRCSRLSGWRGWSANASDWRPVRGARG